MRFYYISQAIDQESETDLTLYRTAFSDLSDIKEYVDFKLKHGAEEAKPLFRKVRFHWAKYSVNPIGDMMSYCIFSTQAAKIFRSLNGEFNLFESIDIEATPAFYIDPKTIEELDDSHDFFRSKKYRKELMVVSERFMSEWTKHGLKGAVFKEVII